MQNDYLRPYKNFRVITVSGYGDVTPFPEGMIRGIKLDGAGTKANLAVKSESNGNVTITGLALNVIHPIATTQIFQTGTTATTITIFW
jgi:hypothetical protein